MEIEKEIIKMTSIHQNIEKHVLIRNINQILREKGICWRQKIQWVCTVTGSPTGTVYTWFTNAKCRSVNKIPLYALCQIAVALKISVYEFLKTESQEKQCINRKIDRRGKLYWHLRREVAEALWNANHDEDEIWESQTQAVRRNFLDNLYLEKVKEGNKEIKAI